MLILLICFQCVETFKRVLANGQNSMFYDPRNWELFTAYSREGVLAANKLSKKVNEQGSSLKKAFR